MSGNMRPGAGDARVHGGPDAAGVPTHDFSTNSNACGPCPLALQALREADRSRYPDPGYSALREALGRLHGVAPERIVVAGSASEFIFRFTAWASRSVPRASVPRHAYGDYAAAARAHGLQIVPRGDPASAGPAGSAASSAGLAPDGPADYVGHGPADQAPAAHAPAGHAADYAPAHHAPAHRAPAHHAPADYAPAHHARDDRARDDHAPADSLAWRCDPSSPLGQPDVGTGGLLQVVDCAYAPLRLSGEPAAIPAEAWQLWSPNKALGLTGVRGAYALAPAGEDAAVAALARLAPSWPLGADGVALLQAWSEADIRQWLEQSRAILRGWKRQQQVLLETLGWALLPSQANFMTCRLPPGTASLLPALRARGIKLRDASSFGLPGHVRVSVQPPAAQQALAAAWKALA